MMHGTWSVFRVVGALLPIEMERGETVLSVEIRYLPRGFFEMSHVLETAHGLEPEGSAVKAARAGNWRLAHRQLVEICLMAATLAFDSCLWKAWSVGSISRRSDDVVVLLDLLGFEALAFAVEATE